MSDGGVIVREEVAHLPTHALIPAGPIPTILDPDGLYPYVSYVGTTDQSEPRPYRLLILESEHIRAAICPDLGGRVFSLVHLGSGRECLHVPEVVRPARILPRFCFVPGGIEVSFPVAHSPVQNEPIRFAVERDGRRAYVTCGERELRHGMRWSVEYSLEAGDAFLTQRVRLHNPGPAAAPWTYWSNAALPARTDTEFHFPDGPVLAHSSRLETIDWARTGPRRQADVPEMTGYFWRQPGAPAFGAFTPSLGCGLYHVADPANAPGMKLWTYGVGRDEAWSWLADTRRRPYIEIQGGPVADQSIRLMLNPGEERSHIEYWIPTDRPLDIRRIGLPVAPLRPIAAVPVFEWARETDAGVWLRLATDPAAEPPPSEAMNWPPSGMDALGPLFEARAGNPSNPDADVWRFHHGTWRAGRGELDAAIPLLAGCRTGVAKALLARILRRTGRLEDARQAMDAVQESWLRLHPQVVVERDELLRALGPGMLPDRALWLNAVAALDDDRIRTRRVRLYLDLGEPGKAKALLLERPFENVHQSYERTGLWAEIARALGQPETPPPDSLGEDRLARFGAYREFDGD